MKAICLDKYMKYETQAELFAMPKEAIAAAIKEAEGRATARTITAVQIIESVVKTEKWLRAKTPIGIPKKSLDGTKIEVDYHAEVFPNAYKYRPESTHFEAENRKGKWYLTRVYRDYCRQNRRRIIVTLSETAKAAILDKYAWLN